MGGCICAPGFWKEFGMNPVSKLVMLVLKLVLFGLSLGCVAGFSARFEGSVCGRVREGTDIWTCYENAWNEDFTVGDYAFGKGGADIVFNMGYEGGQQCRITIKNYDPPQVGHPGKWGAALTFPLLFGVTVSAIPWQLFPPTRDYVFTMQYYGAAGSIGWAFASLAYFQALYYELTIENSCEESTYGGVIYDAMFYPAVAGGWASLIAAIPLMIVDYWLVWGIRAAALQPELDAIYKAPGTFSQSV